MKSLINLKLTIKGCLCAPTISRSWNECELLTHLDVLTLSTVYKGLSSQLTKMDKELTVQKCQWCLLSPFLLSITSTLNVMFLSAMHVLTNTHFLVSLWKSTTKRYQVIGALVVLHCSNPGLFYFLN